MIRIAGLTKRYGRAEVLHDLDLTVPAGSAVALWGANGAGKTTVLLCTLGLVSYRGSITVHGYDASGDGKEARRLIGYVPQRPAFYDELTVVGTLRFSAALRRVDPTAIEAVLSRAGLEGMEGMHVGALSGGMRQRLALAVALLADPPVLLLDEPLGNLDVAARSATVNLLQGLRGPDRILVVTSHHLEEVSLLADRVILMEQGRVAGDCPPGDLADRLGLRSWLHLSVAAEAVPAAIGVLRRLGHDPAANGHGVLVTLAPGDKSLAVAALAAAGIAVTDLEVWR